ncbi:hypothetical protein EJ08DRAFT_663971 [Tothia fuscella]|uniref:Uncharacterized protein n=1 Tax=Tothia fuscella TaxID=1048955 RepID=A0A9P4NK83_9PEZI|nr:hypothetical protein EJ08DRAFT_663971 [Tothia fuscella]
MLKSIFLFLRRNPYKLYVNKLRKSYILAKLRYGYLGLIPSSITLYSIYLLTNLLTITVTKKRTYYRAYTNYVYSSYTYYYSKYTRPPTSSSSSPSKYKRDDTTSPPIIPYYRGYRCRSSSLNFINAFVTRSPSTIKRVSIRSIAIARIRSFNNNKVKEEGGEEDKEYYILKELYTS